MAHIAGLVATGYHPSPIPYAHVVTTTTHKTLRGPRGGMILSSAEFAKEHKLNKAVFPGTQGGPQMHSIAGKAVMLKEDLSPEYKEYARRVVENAQALCSGLISRGVKIVSGGTDNHLMLADRQGNRSSPRQCKYHSQQEYGSARPAQPVRHERYPSRNSGCYYSRNEYRGYGSHCRSDRTGHRERGQHR